MQHNKDWRKCDQGATKGFLHGQCCLGLTHGQAKSAGRAARDLFVWWFTLAFPQGDVGKHRLPNYSRGIRQSIYKMAKEGGWAEKHKVLVSE
jgi:hypothetical protein